MTTKSEPHNPLYLLLLLVSLLFVITALAYAIIPVMEEKARQAGAVVPQSAFRDWLRANGAMWLLIEVALMVVLSLASMWVDRQRLRRLKNSEETGRMPAQATDNPSSPLTVAHEEP